MDSSCQSHDIINEMIQLMATQLLHKVSREINSAEWYSIIADETWDINGVEQLGIYIYDELKMIIRYMKI